jgi:hypothetical protein
MEKEVKILYELFKSRTKTLTDKMIKDVKEFHKEARKNNQSGWGWYDSKYVEKLPKNDKYLYEEILKPIKSMLNDVAECEVREFHITQRMYENKSKLEYFETFDDPDENK